MFNVSGLKGFQNFLYVSEWKAWEERENNEENNIYKYIRESNICAHI